MSHPKWAIIPDVHNKTWLAEKAARLAERQGYSVLFLGDYFDSVNDTTENARETAEWLYCSLQKGRTHLLGNHDACYAWPDHPETPCPGWSEEKQKAILEVIPQKLLQSLPLYHLIQEGTQTPILCSHAGINPYVLLGILPPEESIHTAKKTKALLKIPAETLLELLETKNQEAQTALQKNTWHALLHRGSRIGEPGIGGIYWQDLNDTLPIPGLIQIIGHNRLERPVLDPNEEETGYILHLDCGCKKMAYINGVEIQLAETNPKSIPLP